ncbi:hypothetical protein FRC12_008638 [Ceratobasidium sp. 428]|nr:hypothetical protein FRC12_008638 [Ceratobasidium sp. 428]
MTSDDVKKGTTLAALKGHSCGVVVAKLSLAKFHALRRSWLARRPIDNEYNNLSNEFFSNPHPCSDSLPMASLCPGPAIIQRANLLQHRQERLLVP